MKYIYVVLIESYTGLGKILKKFTGYRYEHIAVSLDKSLTEFYSFSRKQHHHPFKAGFMKEYRDYYAFEEYQKFYSKIFAIPVTEENAQTVKENNNSSVRKNTGSTGSSKKVSGTPFEQLLQRAGL